MISASNDRFLLAGIIFFQAEDGIRDLTVTGIQTCALPILSGVDGGLLTAQPASGGLGHVGDIAEVRVALLESSLLAGLTPVIAPMAPEASGAEGPPLNVNADDAAAAIAGALRAAELLLVSDVSGVEVDGAVRPTLEVGDVETLIELGVAADGMAAKLRAATAALHAGARAGRIGDVHLLGDAPAGRSGER